MSAATPATSFAPPDADYPVRPAGALTRGDWVWLLGLLLLALIPRAVVAARLGPVCDDGYFYLAVADAYERGDFSAALHYLNINIYPVLLGSLHSLGLDPLAAAKWWGVAASTLAVLPLFDWLRRMLDRRVAMAACGVYAVHTEFIELSPEPIRDPTFWLFCASGFYFAWRAATERKLWLFACSGLAIALAAHTRTEGWLLALPAVAWPISRWRDAPGQRLKVAVGGALCFAMTPLFIVVFNLTALAGHDRWEWGRLEHLRLVTNTVGAEWPAATKTPVTVQAVPTLAPRAVRSPLIDETARPPIAPPRRLERGRHDSNASIYLGSLGRTLEPVPLLLMLVGAVACRRVLIRREHLVLSACCVAVLGAVWFRLTNTGEINGRYFLLCFFPAAGAAGIGLLATLSFLERRWPAYLRHPRPVVAVAAAAAMVGTAQAGDAVLGSHPSRVAECRLGEALAMRLGPGQSIFVVPRACRVGYFAAGRMPTVMLDVLPIEAVMQRDRPDVVIIESRDTPRAEFDELYVRLVRYGLRPYDTAGLPEADRFVVLTATDAPAVRPLGLARRDGR